MMRKRLVSDESTPSMRRPNSWSRARMDAKYPSVSERSFAVAFHSAGTLGLTWRRSLACVRLASAFACVLGEWNGSCGGRHEITTRNGLTAS
eukprot:877656-Prymnesium_polylepis.1